MSRYHFHPYNWTSKDLKDGFYFFVESHDMSNNTCLVRIKYNPWMYVTCKDNSMETLKKCEQYIRMNTYSNTITRIEFETRKETYYFSSPKRLLMKVYFSKMKNLNYVSGLLSKTVNLYGSEIKFEVYENKDNPILKYHFERGLSHTGWHYIDSPKFITGDNTLSEFQKEILVKDHNTVFFEKDEEKIRTLGLPKMSILSFDIECVSHNGKFPKAEYIDDYMFMIACSFLDRDGTISKHNIVLGHSIKQDNVNLIEIDHDNIKREAELCNRFSNLVKELDPDILIGHNVFKFDWKYMDVRYGTLVNKNIPYMGRYKNWRMLEHGECDSLVEGIYHSEEWESAAYSNQSIGYILVPGRIQMDLLPIVQQLGYKLDSYKLEFISQFFLGEGKTGLEPEEMFHLAKLSRECSKILRSNDSSLIKTSSFKQISNIEVDEDWKAKLDKMGREAMFEIDKYCIQDTMLPIKIIQKINLLIGLIEDAKIVHVNIMDLYTRGQGIRVYSQEYMELKSNGYFIKRIKAEKTNYKGAFVFSALVGYYKRVHCLDFAKLYPSIMIAYNICYTTFVHEDADNPNKDIKDEDCHVFEWEQDGTLYRFRFVKPHILKGVLPVILERLATARDNAKLQLKNEKDPLMRVVLDKRQNNLKISMNSIYGNKGTHMATLPLYQAAMCTTAKGRQLISETAEYITSKYGAKVVYGDTDSVMFVLPILDSGLLSKCTGTNYDDEIPSMITKIAKNVSSLFPHPISMEYEKTFRDYLLVGKKMYAGMLANEKNLNLYDEKKLFFRGLPVVRRDHCKYLRETIKSITRQIFSGKTEQEVFDYVLDKIEELLSGKVKVEDLFIYKKIGKEENYKFESNDIYQFIRYLKSKGEEPIAGDRYEYVIAKIQSNWKGEKYRTIKHLKEDKLEIDYDLYFVSDFVKPVQKILYRWNPNMFQKNILQLVKMYIDLEGHNDLKLKFMAFFNSSEDITESIKELKKCAKRESNPCRQLGRLE